MGECKGWESGRVGRGGFLVCLVGWMIGFRVELGELRCEGMWVRELGDWESWRIWEWVWVD